MGCVLQHLKRAACDSNPTILSYSHAHSRSPDVFSVQYNCHFDLMPKRKQGSHDSASEPKRAKSGSEGRWAGDESSTEHEQVSMRIVWAMYAAALQVDDGGDGSVYDLVRSVTAAEEQEWTSRASKTSHPSWRWRTPRMRESALFIGTHLVTSTRVCPALRC